MKILILPGDGIGPEIMAATGAALEALNDTHGLKLAFEERVIGLAALETEGATLPDAELQAYPVPTPQFQARDWWRTSAGARLMTMEYLKYLAILGRETVLGLGPQDEDEAPAAQPAG